jgi:hypothetical protein
LADEFQDTRGSAAPPPSSATDDPAQYAGGYWSEKTGAFRRFAVKNGKLVMQSPGISLELLPLGKGEFEYDSEDSERKNKYAFRRSRPGGPYRLQAVEDGAPISYQAVKGADATPARLSGYAGNYSNDELRATWTLVVENGKLIRQQWMNEDQELQPAFSDGFIGELSEGQFLLHFNRDRDNRVIGFDVATEMVRPMKFERTTKAMGH